jgi:hypothetical protein
MVNIDQRWNSISIVFEGEDSRSVSDIAGFETQTAGASQLVYHYFNEPKPGAVPTMEAHPGFARLRVTDSQTLQGDYFTGRGRGTYGEILLTRAAPSDSSTAFE